MDSGEVIPGLNQDWTFVGAKAMEWASGCLMALVFQELFVGNAARNMPLLIIVAVTTTLSLAVLRRRFPDEERGVANLLMLQLGVVPPGIPAPSALQPIWSACPIRTLSAKTEFSELGIEEMLALEKEEERHE